MSRYDLHDAVLLAMDYAESEGGIMVERVDRFLSRLGDYDFHVVPIDRKAEAVAEAQRWIHRDGSQRRNQPVQIATFTATDHASIPGWATYHRRLRGGWRRLVCLIRGHVWPAIPPNPNGYSPGNYARCSRCTNAGKWYVVGQHRFGSLSA